VKHVEAQVKRNRAEMKFVTKQFAPGTTATAEATVINLTGISQGDGTDERIGSKIKCWRVDIRGDVSAGLDVYVVQAQDGTPPDKDDFPGTTSGSFIDGTKNNTTLTEWVYHRPIPHISGVPTPFRIIRKFKGMEVVYGSVATAGTTPVRNGLFLVLRNVSGATLSHSLQARVWYTDP